MIFENLKEVPNEQKKNLVKNQYLKQAVNTKLERAEKSYF